MADCGLPLPCESTISGETDALKITTTGNGAAIVAVATGNGSAIRVESTNGDGVFATCNASNSVGVYGVASDGEGFGVVGDSSPGTGVFGFSDIGPGVLGFSDGSAGVAGGVRSGTGVSGDSGGGFISGGVFGTSTGGLISGGVFGISSAPAGIGVFGRGGEDGTARYFEGNVQVTGLLTKAGGGFKIDHPLEPAHKYLCHSFVESPEMKNVYDGVVDLDQNGECCVELPEWFETLNSDFRYLLTPVGKPAPNLHVAQEISSNRFYIAGGKPDMKVSWQVTGIRKDAWAQAHRLIVEEAKPESERGYYQHPEVYSQPMENSTFWKGNSLEKQRQGSARIGIEQIEQQVRSLREKALRHKGQQQNPSGNDQS
jgi:hypothetical protein